MKTEKYIEQVKRLPIHGKQIIGRTDGTTIIVYQAFNQHIAKYALDNQKFGGSNYNFGRMSWIKPGFLWMMYRAGWASKENQQHILAITISLENFKKILSQATISSFDDKIFDTHQIWRDELSKTEVRLQWDPDHDPFGNKQSRKAIQLGLKGRILKQFATEWIIKIEDITDFCKNEYQKVITKNIDDLNIPFEEIIQIEDEKIEKRIGIEK
ncbi:MAG: DUF4291 domain-containing protein [Emticicia sp.]|uniref:DUF4291 domain-containing protein n=1 Tax=Emticicia sp. TaxID=1930953 RepID=UPI003BA599A7